ncbi:hypothetical protein ACFQY5_32035 [Paeniroseomonas aquatica]|uniref:Uncharacterized protein n=1 Tax=Paeniroseomonas aquatica TaxID=373043 RepID=A0ABT8AAP3_9PROT|nr:hypothetical protein [Paeniroseomonas aquatica]MDN3566681.1 hypothetical protein [Paeniroseomonas aquatica]
MTFHGFDPQHIPPPPHGPRSRPPARPLGRKDRGGLRITVVGLGPFQEACLAGMLALVLSWGSAEVLFRLAEARAARPEAIISASVQP